MFGQNLIRPPKPMYIDLYKHKKENEFWKMAKKDNIVIYKEALF